MKIHQPTTAQMSATRTCYELKGKCNSDTLADILGLSKATLYTRLKLSNWKQSEMLYLEYVNNPQLRKLVDKIKILDNE